MKYIVEITETLQKAVEIDAESDSEAEEFVRQMYDAGELVLDADNHVDTEFDVVRKESDTMLA